MANRIATRPALMTVFMIALSQNYDGKATLLQ